MSTAKQQVQAAKERGFDRAITMIKQEQPVDADTVARNLYPDNTELQNACAAGIRTATR